MRGLVFSVDDAFVMPFKVMFHSLINTDSLPGNVPIFVLHESTLTAPSIRDLEEFATNLDKIITFLDVTPHLPNELPIHQLAHVSKAAFYRLFVTDLLPVSLDSVVYLDSDAVAVRSIKPLFDLSLTHPIAAVDHFSLGDELRIWGCAGGSYFQSGVLVIDLATWRQTCITETFLRTMETEKSRIRWWDQDALNIVFENNWQRLDVWFNVAQCSLTALKESDVLEKAKIIHYDGSCKPWNTDVWRPHKEFWFDAYKATFNKAFNTWAVSRPIWRRCAAKVKALFVFISSEFRRF